MARIVKKVEEPARPPGNKLPVPSPERRKELLEKAREARSARRELLESVRAGRVTLNDILSDDWRDNIIAQRLPVKTLLPALPGVSRPAAVAFMTVHHIGDNRRVSGLGARQRQALLEWRT